MRSNTSGFTIVELLVVIVVIAVLAAITVVAFNGVQNRAYESSVRSDLAMIAKKIELYKISSTGDNYPIAVSGTQRDELETIDIKVGTGAYSTVANSNLTYISSTNGTDYVVLATVKNGPVLYVRGSNPAIQVYTGPPSYPNGTMSNIATAAGLTGTFNEATAAYVSTGGGWRFWD
ncbi:MAG TPA: prepilin-type N-terminal cleavage/methylation domain-containing protein [Candidatus Saccharibacteria bacterium]|nr:prepilin-type N-terminal cleavage/methylation domain-containing protein [Candidatus Saccharibacteria bacterium]HRK94290.1 prepilin-type N-terminal cleavage/methylation domain-containing protein [Candidatus Saccharibacteria bacterium]